VEQRLPSDDTIFAPASGFGRAAVAVIRVSGSRTREILQRLTTTLPPPRRLSLKSLRGSDGEPLDEALVAWMPGPHSFTGEDQAELHVHGGTAVRQAVLGALARIEGCRPAEPGEFTRRAFLNGRMDLSQVEGLADLVDAETEAQRRQALRQLEGHLGDMVEGWRERLIEALALLEAALDFSDEGDVVGPLEVEAAALVAIVRVQIEECLARGSRGERVRDGFTVVIAGPPNVGKSTLLNAIARREVAIVSDIPGTTRDAIEVRCDLDGLPVTFVDTAGLRDTTDVLEQAGMSRTRAHAARADAVLMLRAPDLAAEDETPIELDLGAVPVLRVSTKGDLGPATGPVDAAVSAITGEGMAELLARISEIAEAALGHGDAILTRERHREALERTASALVRAEAVDGETELAAEDVRLALRALGQITGRVDVEDVLDRLFATFCIGK
jgi:tRNA modification GTPase